VICVTVLGVASNDPCAAWAVGVCVTYITSFYDRFLVGLTPPLRPPFNNPRVAYQGKPGHPAYPPWVPRAQMSRVTLRWAGPRVRGRGTCACVHRYPRVCIPMQVRNVASARERARAYVARTMESMASSARFLRIHGLSRDWAWNQGVGTVHPPSNPRNTPSSYLTLRGGNTNPDYFG
jgi:hypothetical protein